MDRPVSGEWLNDRSRLPMIARLTAFIAVVIFAVSCSKGVSPVKTRSLSRPNPTVYSFPLPLEQVRTRACLFD